MKKSLSRRAFTLVEIFVTIAILVIVAVFVFSNLLGGRNQADLSSATNQIVASARQAQSQSMAGSGSVTWGIHFANVTNTAPFYALFTGSSYASGTVQGRYPLPPTVNYITSTLPVGLSEDITFSKITGVSSASTSIGLYLISNPSIHQYISISGLGQIGYPASILLSYLYVADNVNDNIQKFDSTGSYISQFGSFGTGNGQFDHLRGIAIDSSGNIYAVDGHNNRIEKFNSTGAYQFQIGICGAGSCTATSTAGGFNSPQFIATDSNGNVYVVDAGNDRVEKFDSTGHYISQFGSSGTGNGQFKNPIGIAIDPSGNIYVSDLNNENVQKFDSTGHYISQLTSIVYPHGAPLEAVSVDPIGNLYVSVANFGPSSTYAIEKFDSTGNYISQFAPYGSGNGQIGTFAASLAFDFAGNIYAADLVDYRVEKFDSTGHYISQFGSSGTGNGQFSHVLGIAVGNN